MFRGPPACSPPAQSAAAFLHHGPAPPAARRAKPAAASGPAVAVTQLYYTNTVSISAPHDGMFQLQGCGGGGLSGLSARCSGRRFAASQAVFCPAPPRQCSPACARVRCESARASRAVDGESVAPEAGGLSHAQNPPIDRQRPAGGFADGRTATQPPVPTTPVLPCPALPGDGPEFTLVGFSSLPEMPAELNGTPPTQASKPFPAATGRSPRSLAVVAVVVTAGALAAEKAGRGGTY